MSKRFKRQNYTRFKKLGTKWHRARGHHSKMRVSKVSHQNLPSISLGTPRSEKYKVNGLIPIVISCAKHTECLDPKSHAAVISGKVGLRKAIILLDSAKKAGLKVLNEKHIRRQDRMHKTSKQKIKQEKEKKAKAGATAGKKKE